MEESWFLVYRLVQKKCTLPSRCNRWLKTKLYDRSVIFFWDRKLLKSFNSSFLVTFNMSSFWCAFGCLRFFWRTSVSKCVNNSITVDLSAISVRAYMNSPSRRSFIVRWPATCAIFNCLSISFVLSPRI